MRRLNACDCVCPSPLESRSVSAAGFEKLIGLVSTTRDITAGKHAEEQLANYAESCVRKKHRCKRDLAAARQLRPTGHLRRRNAFSKTTIRPGSGSRFNNSEFRYHYGTHSIIVHLLSEPQFAFNVVQPECNRSVSMLVGASLTT
jgi:hypothetical protein